MHGESIRSQVLTSGVLHMMLVRAWSHMRTARRRAGARRTPARTGQVLRKGGSIPGEAEARSAGYAVRAHALAAWANEVLA